MAITQQPYIAPEPYSGTFSAGTFDIYPASGLNYSPYNTTVGTPVPYMYPIAYTTGSIVSSQDETVYISIQYYIPEINNTDININRGTMYYQLDGGTEIPNAIIELQQDPVTASGYPLSATPYSISSIGAPYEITHSSRTYMCSNNESLILALVNTNPASTQNFKLTDANVVSMISAPLYPGQSNIARTTITSTNSDIWAVLVYRADLVWAQSYKAIMFRDFKVQRYKSVTQISDKGVLIFNNPDQYVKFSSESNGEEGATQHSIISVDTLKAHTIYADNIISDNTTTKGGDSPTGGGIQGLQYDGNKTITSDYTISAPAFSGSGFYLPDDYIPTTAFGHYSAGSPLLKGKNLLQAIQSAFMYQSPSITLDGDAPTITWGNADDPFITTAMNATTTWGWQYQLPAMFATTTVSVTYSGVSWEYKNQQNIDWSTIVSAHLTSSATSQNGTVQALTDLPATYFSSSTAGIAYSRGPVTYSVKFAKADNVASSRNQSATLTPTRNWSNVKDTLNNAIAAPALIVSAQSKTTHNLGRYGSRFMVVRQKSDDSGVQWRACNSSGTIMAIDEWGSYDQAFNNSVPFLGTATEIQKTLTMHSNLYDGTSGDRPVSLVLLAPSNCVIYSTTNTRGLWGQGAARLTCCTFNTAANTPSNGLMNYADAQNAAFNLTGINAEGDPASAFGSSATGFTKTWPIGLTSTMKLFIIRTLTSPRTANWTMTWYAN